MKKFALAIVLLVMVFGQIGSISAAPTTFSSPVWNTSTQMLAYVRDGNTLLLRDVNTRYPFVLTTLLQGCAASDLSWNPDGSQLLYAEACDGQRSAIRTMLIADDKEVSDSPLLVSPSSDITYSGASFNRTGTLLAYNACYNGTQCEVRVLDTATKAVTETNQWTPTAHNAVWMPGSDEFLMVVQKGGFSQLAIWGKTTGITVLSHFTQEVTPGDGTAMNASQVLLTSGTDVPVFFSYDISANTYTSMNMVGKQPSWYADKIAFVGAQGDFTNNIVLADLDLHTVKCLSCN